MVRTFVALLIAGLSFIAAPAGASTCTVAAGDAVMLRSSDFDPDVLVWDSRQRAIDYVGGPVKSNAEVLNHTVLARPGTRALVIACDAGSSKPRYSTVIEDTIGIKITTGPNKGRYGWVSSSDTHSSTVGQTAAP